MQQQPTYGQPMYGQQNYGPGPTNYGQPMNQVGFHQQPGPVVVVQGQNASGSYCPVCNTNTGSRIDYEVSGNTWVWCILLFFFTGICCWIPFVCDDCKSRVVECSTCGGKKG